MVLILQEKKTQKNVLFVEKWKMCVLPPKFENKYIYSKLDFRSVTF